MLFYTYRRAFDLRRGHDIHELAKFNDTSAPTEVYELWQARGGRWVCTCPASFRPHNDGTKCKHPTYVRAFEEHGAVGWAWEPEANRWHDLFPIPRGANRLLVDVRGEDSDAREEERC